jgi:hypothetical protein
VEDELNISHEDLRTILTRPIAFHRLFADIGGSVGGGVFLSQLYYWSERTVDPEGWLLLKRKSLGRSLTD